MSEIKVPRELIEFAITSIAMTIMRENGLFYSETKPLFGFKDFEDNGHMPAGYYDLKALLDADKPTS